VIVNAAAHTAVDKAESEPELARCLNAQAPTVLAREAAALGAWLVHYSTDYVFDGSGTQPWLETDATGPLGVYGQTKLEGEQGIAASGCRHLIFRTSWVYAARGGNFAKTMLKLAKDRERLTVINDQFGAPTGADLIADVTAHAIRQVRLQIRMANDAANDPDGAASLSGIYHLVASGVTTWFDYANHVLGLDAQRGFAPGLAVKEVAPVPSTAFVTTAKRPHNSRLSTAKLQQAFGLTLPAWQQGVNRMLAEIA
jgi:dTDP-4-dehydrorhamnose reductase